VSVVEGGVDAGRAPKPACWSGWTGNFLGAAATVLPGGGATEEGCYCRVVVIGVRASLVLYVVYHSVVLQWGRERWVYE
jgi:hypothetical protein